MGSSFNVYSSSFPNDTSTKRNMKYLPVNWKDGMKITKVHFQQTENSWQDHLHHSTKAYINGHNFGLLPHANELNVMVDDE